MNLTPEEVRHIALLARIGLSEEDVVKFQGQLSGILDHFQALQQLDTEGVPPTSHPLALESVMRADDEGSSLTQEEVLANAPMVEEDSFRVRAILE